MHLNVSQFEKAKYYDRHPWLLPKSFENCNSVQSLPFSSLKKLFCANCQVRAIDMYVILLCINHSPTQFVKQIFM